MRVSELLNTLTEESHASIITKCEELGFDINRGEISLLESFINLDQSRDMLEDAVKKDKLSQLPFTIQKTLLTNLQSIITHQLATSASAKDSKKS